MSVSSGLDKHPHPKQRQHYGIDYLLASHPIMRRLRAAGSTQLHGNKNWGAAFLLMDYLQQHPLAPHSRVLDVGCGWGLGGIYCAKHLDASVIASDADSAVFPFLQAQAAVNNVTVDCQPWAFEDIPDAELARSDCLIGSDICFWDDMAEGGYQMIARAVDAGCGQILLSDPGRPPFLAVAEACVDDFYAELLPVEACSQRHHRGFVLRLENR